MNSCCCRTKSPTRFGLPGELDQLWFEFFATGKVEPVRRLVEQLARPGEMLTPKEFKAKKEKGETTPGGSGETEEFPDHSGRELVAQLQRETASAGEVLPRSDADAG
ncbi:MAG: hypothetical protein L6W00_11115 [Lentisphaeria bacterium]|nr:MAG: hypothetical protein L6W00_11115 [Lentisphaeria bacterium]